MANRQPVFCSCNEYSSRTLISPLSYIPLSWKWQPSFSLYNYLLMFSIFPWRLHSKHCTSTECWANVGPASQTVSQHLVNVTCSLGRPCTAWSWRDTSWQLDHAVIRLCQPIIICFNPDWRSVFIRQTNCFRYYVPSHLKLNSHQWLAGDNI